MRALSILGVCLFLAGCGKGFKAEDVSNGRQEEVDQGEYAALLQPMNRKVGSYEGWLKLIVGENQFWARLRLDGEKDRVKHPQFLHVGTHCPDESSDLNDDGYIDFSEVVKATGKPLIPLDASLETQLGGLFDFPMMRRSGFYYYSEAGNLDRMMEDLRNTETRSEFTFAKLKFNENLDPMSTVIIVYGVDESIPLPSSVSDAAPFTSHQLLPIACGTLGFGPLDDQQGQNQQSVAPIK